jgi:hypothetical protein
VEGHQHGAQPQPKKPAPKPTPVAELVGRKIELTKLERMETAANLSALAFQRAQLEVKEQAYRISVARRALDRRGIVLEDDAELPIKIESAPDGSMVSFTVVSPEKPEAAAPAAESEPKPIIKAPLPAKVAD